MNPDLPIYDSNVLYVLRAVFLPGAVGGAGAGAGQALCVNETKAAAFS